MFRSYWEFSRNSSEPDQTDQHKQRGKRSLPLLVMLLTPADSASRKSAMELFDDDIIVDMNVGNLDKKKPNIFDDLMGEEEEIDDFFFDDERKRSGATNPFESKSQDELTQANYDLGTNMAGRAGLQGFEGNPSREEPDNDKDDFGLSHKVENYQDAFSLPSGYKYTNHDNQGDEAPLQSRNHSRELNDHLFELDVTSQTNGKQPKDKDTTSKNPEPEKSVSDSNALTPDASPNEEKNELEPTNESTQVNHCPAKLPKEHSDLPTNCNTRTSVDTHNTLQSSTKGINWARVWEIIEGFEKQVGSTGKNQVIFKSIIHSLANK